MKKTLRFAPAFIIAAAALLCLSFDNNGRLFSEITGDNESTLFRTGGSGIWKNIVDKCPDSDAYYVDCQSGGNMECLYKECPTTILTYTVAL